jgi:hypothetical protein
MSQFSNSQMVIDTNFISAKIEFSVSSGQGVASASITVLPTDQHNKKKMFYYYNGRLIGQHTEEDHTGGQGNNYEHLE